MPDVKGTFTPISAVVVLTTMEISATPACMLVLVSSAEELPRNISAACMSML